MFIHFSCASKIVGKMANVKSFYGKIFQHGFLAGASSHIAEKELNTVDGAGSHGKASD